jgi:hypothetical protein
MAKEAVINHYDLPAPLEGLVLGANPADMPPTQASTLTNWIPETYGIRHRAGWAEYYYRATPVTGSATDSSSRLALPVTTLTYTITNTGSQNVYYKPGNSSVTATTGDTLLAAGATTGTLTKGANTHVAFICAAGLTTSVSIAYVSGGDITTMASLTLVTGVEKMIGIASTDIFDISDSAAIASILGAATITNPTWYTCIYKNTLLMCNGVNAPLKWTGTGDVAAISFTGPTAANLIFPTTYKSRDWYIEKDTAKIWYNNAIDTIGGTYTALDLSSVFQRGGYLLWAGPTSRQTGSQERELMCFISSKGEVLVYQGDYPGATTWGIVGRYFIAPPPHKRAVFQLYSKLFILTSAGILSLDTIMATDVNQAKLTAISKNIQQGIAGIASISKDVIVNEAKNQLLITTSTSKFYYLNTLTGAWCIVTPSGSITGTASGCVFGNIIYVNNGSESVHKFEGSNYYADTSRGASASYTCTMIQGATDLAQPNNDKQIREICPKSYAIMYSYSGSATGGPPVPFSLDGLVYADLNGYGVTSSDYSSPAPVPTSVLIDSLAYSPPPKRYWSTSGGYNRRKSGLQSIPGKRLILSIAFVPNTQVLSQTYNGVAYAGYVDGNVVWYGADVYFTTGAVR